MGFINLLSTSCNTSSQFYFFLFIYFLIFFSQLVKLILLSVIFFSICNKHASLRRKKLWIGHKLDIDIDKNFLQKRAGRFSWLFRCQFHQRFYVQIFHTNVVSAAFSSYILALAKNSYKKHARIMLMILTAGGLRFKVCDSCSYNL